MADDKDDDDDMGKVLVFRNPETGQPVAVPTEVALMAERPYRAWHLHQAGLTWREIASQEGYADARAAQYDVSRYMQEGAALVADHSRRDLMEVEIARLNTLQATIWPQAMKGHLPAVREVMNLGITRVKFLEMIAAIPQVSDTGMDQGTVIIPGGDSDYITTLQQVAGDELTPPDQ